MEIEVIKLCVNSRSSHRRCSIRRGVLRFCKISKNTFSTEHLRVTASVIPNKLLLDSRQTYPEEQNREPPPLLESTGIPFLFSL